jgi:hypothetical protein
MFGIGVPELIVFAVIALLLGTIVAVLVTAAVKILRSKRHD